ncbi:hypothetical protein BH10BDE1_BH10BDE1_14090 [soil metagenome]
MLKLLLDDHREVEILRTVNPALPRPEDFTFALAKTNDDFLAAGHLLYESYQRRQIAFVNTAKIRVIPQIMTPGTTVIVGKSKGVVICTATVVCRNPFDFPIAEILSAAECAEHLSDNDGAVAEIASLAIADDYLAPKSGAFHYLVGYLHEYLKVHLNIAKIVVGTQPVVVDYYRAMFGFLPIRGTAARLMPSAGNDPTVPLVVTMERFEKKIVSNAKRMSALKPFVRLFLEEPHVDPKFEYLKEPVQNGVIQLKSVGLIEELFLKQTDLMTKVDPAKRMRTEAMYPETDDYRWVFHNDAGKSRRGARRFTVNIPTVIAVRSAGNGTTTRVGLIVDISEHGAFLVLSSNQAALPKNGEITFTIAVSETVEASVHGEVTRMDDDQKSYGIRVTSAGSAFHDYIRSLSDAKNAA